MIMVSEHNECGEGGIAAPPPNTERWHPSTEEGGVASPPPNTERWHPSTEEGGVASPPPNTERWHTSTEEGGVAIPHINTDDRPKPTVIGGRAAIPSLDTESNHTPTVNDGRDAIPSLDTERREEEPGIPNYPNNTESWLPTTENSQENRVIMSQQLGNENGYCLYTFKETAPNENKQSFQNITKKDEAVSQCIKKENYLFSQTTINEDDLSHQTTPNMKSQSVEKIIDVSSKPHNDSQLTSQSRNITPTSTGTVFF